MALFSFGDIRFKSASRNGFGVNGRLTGENTYDSNILRYPSDLGNTDKGHYMVIHVNEQKKSQFKSGPVSNGDVPTIFENRINYGLPTLGSNFTGSSDFIYKELDKLTNGGMSNISNFLNNNNIDLNTFGISTDRESFDVGFTRTIQRTSDTIALYMPDTLNFTYNQQYSGLNLGGSLGSALLAGGASAVDAIQNNPSNAENAVRDGIQNLSPFALSMLAQNSNLGQVFFAAGAQMVQNPMMELLYTSPAFRTFRFDFMMYPRSEKEAEEVQRILARLKFHQAPEINRDTNGFFLIPPSEFDIKFYYNGKENPNIPKISTCVLETIDIDFAPNGFSAYEVPGESVPSVGGTGMPVAIRLSLQFKETEYLLKDHYQGRTSTYTSSFGNSTGELRTPDEIQASLDLGDFPG